MEVCSLLSHVDCVADMYADIEFALKHEVDEGRALEAELKRAINAEIKAWKDALIQK